MSNWFNPKTHGLTWSDVFYHLKSAFAVLLSLAVLVGGALWVGSKAYSAWNDIRESDDYIGEGIKDVEVKIPAGASLYQMADILVGEDVIKSAKAFDVLAINNEDAKKIRAGRYRLKTHIPAAKALEMLLDPANQIKLKITILEGWTKKQIFDKLSAPKDKGGLGLALADLEKAAADPQALGLPKWVGKNIEGYLYPDTYDMINVETAEEALQMMTDEYMQVAKQLNVEAGAKNNGMTAQEIMALAAIVEAEVNRDADRPKVARVIYNRLNQGWKLGMDSTVHYAVGKTGSVTTSAEDRANPSPYNTYLHPGLPPGPIGSPSRKSIEAALNPADGNWMYFVTINLETGETVFAVNDQEHAANVAKYQAYCQANKGKC